MSSTKVSELPEKTTYTGADYIPIITGGVNKKISATNLLQTKADSATASKISEGVDAPATTPAKAFDTFVNTALGLVYVSKGIDDAKDWFLLNRYRLFGFTVNQVGTDDPDYIFLTAENIGNLTFARTGTGTYTITSDYSAEFPEATTGVPQRIRCDVDGNPAHDTFIMVVRTSAVIITITTTDISGSAGDGLLTGQYVEFKVFNPLS